MDSRGGNSWTKPRLLPGTGTKRSGGKGKQIKSESSGTVPGTHQALRKEKKQFFFFRTREHTSQQHSNILSAVFPRPRTPLWAPLSPKSPPSSQRREPDQTGHLFPGNAGVRLGGGGNMIGPRPLQWFGKGGPQGVGARHGSGQVTGVPSSFLGAPSAPGLPS